ncbi:MAG: preprotein translocase subunit SecG [Candidatus Fibromonas sp.]|jgi:preprotein translocase subunit SecG|nr:preprotein translocase subunit SecG [Candidatus Fibromonas sp.]
MGTVFWILIVAHVALCVLLILLVLVQNDKMGGLAGLGGMTAQSAFSTAGAATFIQKLTRYVALALFAVVLSLGVMATKQDSGSQASALQKEAMNTGQGAILDGNFNFPVE